MITRRSIFGFLAVAPVVPFVKAAPKVVNITVMNTSRSADATIVARVLQQMRKLTRNVPGAFRD